MTEKPNKYYNRSDTKADRVIQGVADWLARVSEKPHMLWLLPVDNGKVMLVESLKHQAR